MLTVHSFLYFPCLKFKAHCFIARPVIMARCASWSAAFRMNILEPSNSVAMLLLASAWESFVTSITYSVTLCASLLLLIFVNIYVLIYSCENEFIIHLVASDQILTLGSKVSLQIKTGPPHGPGDFCIRKRRDEEKRSGTTLQYCCHMRKALGSPNTALQRKVS
jgi:hypothetical protein